PAVDTGACSAGASTALTGPTYGVDGADDLPVTCVRPEQAAAYCTWLGATLPTASAWLMAARGSDVHRVATGAEPPPHAPGAQAPDGVSPFGMKRVLATPAELLMRSTDTDLGACSGTVGHCVVKGTEPGAIDFVAPYVEGADPTVNLGAGTSAFRCMWSK